VKPRPAGERWVEALEKWLALNQDQDIIYAVAVGHRDGYTTLLSNMSEKHAAAFLRTHLEQMEKPAIYDSSKESKPRQ